MVVQQRRAPAKTRQGPTSPGSDKTGPTLKEQAYQSLRKRIVTDGFSPGDMIDDAREAELLGMSRTPVREALLLLEAENLVEMLPRRGVRVVPISRADIQEVIVVLTALETSAVGLIAAQGPSTDRLAPLSEACRAMDAALKSDDPDEWLEADEAFHRGLLMLSANRHLAEIGIRYREKIQRGHFVASRLLPGRRRMTSTANHKELVALLLSENPERAVGAHREQRIGGETEIIGALKRAKLDRL